MTRILPHKRILELIKFASQLVAHKRLLNYAASNIVLCLDPATRPYTSYVQHEMLDYKDELTTMGLSEESKRIFSELARFDGKYHES